MVPHPSAICSVFEMAGMTDLAIRYRRLSTALDMPKIPRRCCNCNKSARRATGAVFDGAIMLIYVSDQRAVLDIMDHSCHKPRSSQIVFFENANQGQRG
mmetsp:Transcript_20987/g.45634  ORF Transcript_20987/g.45634 Transcript_20987/m.45634 type:complete len:99 (+) Transcript_20987:2889-3185(+)